MADIPTKGLIRCDKLDGAIQKIEDELNSLDEYFSFEIILSLNEDGRIEVDWDYDEGEDDYIIDGWAILSRLLERVHNLILVIPEGLRWI